MTPQNYSRWYGDKCNYKGINEGMKKCAFCKKSIYKEEFSKNKLELDTYNRMCKNCVKSYIKSKNNII